MVNFSFPANGKFRSQRPKPPQVAAAATPKAKETPAPQPVTVGPWAVPFNPPTGVVAVGPQVVYAPQPAQQMVYAPQPAQQMVYTMPYAHASAPWPTVHLPIAPAKATAPKKTKSEAGAKKPLILQVAMWSKGIDSSNGEACWVHPETKQRVYTDPYE